ncbi:MAG: class I SAM-dependent methyltransferase [Myxococcales bacterium]|nr:class I SAM-dependent methyltransferase [Myxococcales bacterium]
MKRHDVVWTPEKIGSYWDFISATTRPENYFTYAVGAVVARHVAREVPLAGRSVLDFGCGPGHLFRHMVKAAPTMKYFGMDFSAGSIEQLERQWGTHAQFSGGAAIDGFPITLDRQFDVIVCCEVIEHLDDPTLEHVCELFARVLRPGGTLYLTTPNDEDMSRNTTMCPDCGATFHRWQHMRTWNARSLVAQLARHGFTDHRAIELAYAPNWLQSQLLTRARQVLGRPQPNLCYIGTRA